MDLIKTTLFVVLFTTYLALGRNEHEEDFAFDTSDDLEVEFEENDKEVLETNKDLKAFVGRVFHLVLATRKTFAGKTFDAFEAKRHGGKNLPSWLLFDKKGGIFWGIPLGQDIGIFYLEINGYSAGEKVTEEIKIKVFEPTSEAPGVEKCTKDEDITVLSLLLDKNVHAIKPKQRIIAVNNIAKFFGLPYSAFTLKAQTQNDDITDKSVILAGPGNLRDRTSKLTSLLQVPVGCDGRLWLSTAPVVHQLKQQARDGTVSEVLRLPLIGWRVKTESAKIVRSKRDIVVEDDLGSGDYDDKDEYYDSDYDYEEEDLGDIEKIPPSPRVPVTLPPQKPSTTPISPESSTHPHRHHHGEVNPSVAILRDHHVTHHQEESNRTTTVHLSSPTTTPTTTTTIPVSSGTSVPLVIDLDKVNESEDVPEYDQYDYGNYDNEDDDVESETIIPDLSSKQRETVPPVFENTESLTTEETVAKSTEKQMVLETATIHSTVVNETTTNTVGSTTTTTLVPTTISTSTTNNVIVTTSTATLSNSTTTSEPPTTFQIIVESAPEIDYVTEISKAITSQETTPTSTVITTANTTLPPTMTTAVTNPTSTSTNAATTEIITPKEETTIKITTTRQKPTTTPKATTTVRDVTETYENFNPFIENRLQQHSVIAGKIFRFVIPENTFKDFEDGYDLTYMLLDANNRTITNNTWLHFNPLRREIYGLPLEEDVSKWIFWVRAYDRDGGSVQEKLNIQVQQHKLDLVVNHEFSLYIRIEKQQEFPHYVDWSLKILRALGKIYNTNMSEITVRHINSSNEPAIFTWSNDSLLTNMNICPRAEIEELYRILTANDRGDPSRELNFALAPELRVKKVLYREIGVCEPQPQTPVTAPENFSPILRNPVDHVNATVGELLVYKVKDDTFYDPEDVDPRMLNISLLTATRQPIPLDNWLQFDSKNREFYGIPRKAGRSEYQLVCVDSGGLPATDSLEVIVYPPTKRFYNVEFIMNITEIPYDNFVTSAALQRKFVEKLMQIFGDSTAENIYLLPFRKSYDSTIVTWFNKSLPTSHCAHDDIKYLESVLHSMNDKSISYRVHSLMEPEFQVATIKVHLLNNCKPPEKKIEIGIPIETSEPESVSDKYLTTVIVPAIIILVMLFLAAVAAIVLYRRRRVGKMNVEEDGRASYGNKGIPVIFQEELEEKPEPGTKAPIILKDEKPPLAPPEYSKSGSVRLTDDSEPYQPPPPFTCTQENGRQLRPKPTPTYRKPPPYVPP